MAFSYRRYAAITTAIVCAAAMTGCSDNGYIGKIDGKDIRTGIYLTNLMAAYNEGHSNIVEVKEEAGDTSEVGDVFSQTIDGKNAEEWIKEQAVENTKRYIAIENLFSEKCDTASFADDLKEINADVNDTWNSDSINYYGFSLSVESVYGYPTMGEYYEAIGIGLDSMKAVEQNKFKADQLFLQIYNKDEATKVSDDELNAYLKDNYANVKYIELQFEDLYGINLEDEAKIEEIKELAKSYVDRINGGESFIDVYHEQAVIDAKNEAQVNAEDALEVEGAEQPEDFDAYIEQARESVTVEKAESIEELETVISKESSSLDEQLTEYVWTMKEDGKAYYFETPFTAYVVIREDITTKTEWKENNIVYLLSQLRSDEFDELLKAEYDDYSVELDSYLYDTKYAPHTYKAFNTDKEK